MKAAQERVLGHVLGVVTTHDPGRDPEDHVAVALHQTLERGRVSRAGLVD